MDIILQMWRSEVPLCSLIFLKKLEALILWKIRTTSWIIRQRQQRLFLLNRAVQPARAWSSSWHLTTNRKQTNRWFLLQRWKIQGKKQFNWMLTRVRSVIFIMYMQRADWTVHGQIRHRQFSMQTAWQVWFWTGHSNMYGNVEIWKHSWRWIQRMFRRSFEVVPGTKTFCSRDWEIQERWSTLPDAVWKMYSMKSVHSVRL